MNGTTNEAVGTPGSYYGEEAADWTTAFTLLDNATYTRNLTGACRWNGLTIAIGCGLVVTFVFNVFASVILFRVPLVTGRGRSNPVYLCIRFLNITDVAQSVLILVMLFLIDPNCKSIGSELGCNLMGALALFLLLISPLITILMAFDRVIALYQPFKYRAHLGLKILSNLACCFVNRSQQMLKVLLPSAGVLVAVVTVLPLAGVGEYHVVVGRRMCLLDTFTDDPTDTAYVLTVHCIFLTALIFMATCTITFQIKLCRMSFERKHQSTTRRRPAGKRTRNATITTMAVCFIFIVCYLPYVGRVLHETVTSEKSTNLPFTYVTFVLAFMQPLLNPIVYLTTNVRYRKEFQIIMRRLKSTDYESSTDSGTGNSRSAISVIRRRISGNRGSSKRASQKAKSSQQGSNGGQPTVPMRAQNGGTTQRPNSLYSTRSRARSSSDAYEAASTAQAVTRANSTLERRPAGATVRREPSSSSGVRSFDSHEQIPSASFKRPFGRLGRTSEEDPIALPSNVVRRERSATVSGEITPTHKRHGCRRHSGGACPASPLLQEYEIKCVNSPKNGRHETSFSFSPSDLAAMGVKPTYNGATTYAHDPAEFVVHSNGYTQTAFRAVGERSSMRCIADLIDDDTNVFNKPRHRDSGVCEVNVNGVHQLCTH